MIRLRRFEEKDAQAPAELMVEMARLYEATIRSDSVVTKDVVRQARQVNVIVAHDGASLLGFATFTSLYPVAGLLAFAYVQQVYVDQAARRLGVVMTSIARAFYFRATGRLLKRYGVPPNPSPTSITADSANPAASPLGAPDIHAALHVFDQAAQNSASG